MAISSNIEKLKEDLYSVVNILKDGKVTAYRIHIETGKKVPQATLGLLKKGIASADNISFRNAIALISWYRDIYLKGRSRGK